MVICQGCNVEFPSALSHATHLRRTRIPACRDVFLQALAYLPNIASDSDSDTKMDDETYLGLPIRNSGSDGVPEPARFAGDFFGEDYGMEDFGMADDSEGSELGIVSDSDDEDDFNQGQGWEPACGTPPSRSPSSEEEIVDEDDKVV